MIYAAFEFNCVPVGRAGGGVGRRRSRREWFGYLAMITGDREELQDTLKHRGKPLLVRGDGQCRPLSEPFRSYRRSNSELASAGSDCFRLRLLLLLLLALRLFLLSGLADVDAALEERAVFDADALCHNVAC